MAKDEFVTASTIAASTTSNVLNGRNTSVAPYARTVQFLAVGIQDNTPTLGDLTWVLRAGPVEIARGRGIIVGTGAEFTFPDSYTEVRMQIAPNAVLQLDVTNADGAAAHGAMVSMILDRL